MIAKGCVGLEMVKEGWKCSDSVLGSLSIGRNGWNMCTEPGAAHHQGQGGQANTGRDLVKQGEAR
jgi:hypothetical protein